MLILYLLNSFLFFIQSLLIFLVSWVGSFFTGLSCLFMGYRVVNPTWTAFTPLDCKKIMLEGCLDDEEPVAVSEDDGGDQNAPSD